MKTAVQVGRSPAQSEKGTGEEQGLLSKPWKVKSRTGQESSLKKRWEQTSKCVSRRRENRCRQ